MSTGCSFCSKMVFVEHNLNFCGYTCKLQYHKGMARKVTRSMHTLSLLGEPFGTIEKFIENRNENLLETRTRKPTSGMQSFSTESSSGSSSISSSTVESTTGSRNRLSSNNRYSGPFSTLLQIYSPSNKDVFYETFKLCHAIDSSADSHKFIQKTGTQLKKPFLDSVVLLTLIDRDCHWSRQFVDPILGQFCKTSIDTLASSINLKDTALARQMKFMQTSILNYYENHRRFYSPFIRRSTQG